MILIMMPNFPIRINDEPRDDGEEIFNVRQNGMLVILAQDKQESFGRIGPLGHVGCPNPEDQKPWLTTVGENKSLKEKKLSTALKSLEEIGISLTRMMVDGIFKHTTGRIATSLTVLAMSLRIEWCAAGHNEWELELM